MHLYLNTQPRHATLISQNRQDISKLLQLNRKCRKRQRLLQTCLWTYSSSFSLTCPRIASLRSAAHVKRFSSRRFDWILHTGALRLAVPSVFPINPSYSMMAFAGRACSGACSPKAASSLGYIRFSYTNKTKAKSIRETTRIAVSGTAMTSVFTNHP
jgi:hypothetical protein